jgi:hypothetical protein
MPVARTREDVLRAVAEYGSAQKAAIALGMHRRTVERHVAGAKIEQEMGAAEPSVTHPRSPLPDAGDFSVEAPPKEVDLEELLDRRKREFARKRELEEANKLVRVDVKLGGPIAIWHCGDPHVDDDGTDLDALERHTEIVRRTQGFFAGNVGDTTNNWVGRLARLYGEQSTSAREAWELAQWLVNRCRWMYMVAGNHDCWSGAGDPLRWMAGQSGALYKETSVRLGLKFPNGREVRVNVRHDFAGHSQWNPAHGSMKAAQFGTHDHILVNGHKHISGYGVIKDGVSGIVSHCIQVASYKIFDRYAKEKGFRDQMISPCAVTVIDPEASEASLIQPFWEPEPAAEYLTWLRAKRRAA